MDELPIEVIANILTYLSVENLKNARLVSKRLYYASFYQNVMRNVLHSIEEETPLCKLDGTPIMYANVRLKYASFVPDVQFWIDSSGTITSLDISDCDAPTLPAFRYCTNIRTVKFSRCILPDLVDNKCSTIRELNFDTCCLVDSFLFTLFESITGLESFTLNHCQGAFFAFVWKRFYPKKGSYNDRVGSSYVLSFKFLLRLFRDQYRTLRRLTMCHVQLGDPAIHEILHDGLLKLTHLDFTETSCINVCARCFPREYFLSPEVTIERNKLQSNLISLNVSKCAVDDTWLPHLCCMLKLIELNISFTMITIKGFAEFLINSPVYPDIRSLDISLLSCEPDDTWSLDVIAETFSNLKHLNVSETNCTDCMIQAVCGRLPNLESLALDHCPITGGLLADGLPNSSKLKRLWNLRKVSLRQRKPFEEGTFVGRFRFEHLREVILPKSISRTDLMSIATDNPNLESITFQSAVEHDVLQDIVPMFKNLKFLKCDDEKETKKMKSLFKI